MSLESAILRTVAFFDIFDYPLTDFEIWQYLDTPASYVQVRRALRAAALPLEQAEAFWHLPGRTELAARRRQRYVIADQKIKKAKRRLRLIQWLPGIRWIALANSIGSHNLRGGGDVDLFVITAPGRLWLVKTAASVILKFSGLRPTEQASADKLCLSFLVDETALSLAPYRLADDRYFTYWLAGLTPLFGDPDAADRLLAANPWLAASLPNWTSACRLPRQRFTAAARRSKGIPLGTGLNSIARALHQRFMSQEIKERANRDSRVVVGDHVLKLHTVDRRDYFKQEYENRLRRLAFSAD